MNGLYELKESAKRVERYINTQCEMIADVAEDGRIIIVKIKPSYWDEVWVGMPDEIMECVGNCDVGTPSEIFPNARKLWAKYRDIKSKEAAV